MQAFNRRAFLKGTGTFALAAAASGLLCGAAEVQEETEPDTTLCTIGGLRVLDVGARVSKFPSDNYPYNLEVYFDLENTNDFPVYFNQENFLVHLGNVRRDTYAYFSGLNKWNGSRYIQDVHLEPGERQTISYSCKLQAEDLEAGLRAENPVPWCIALLYGQQRQSFTGYLLPDQYSSDFTAGPVESTAFPAVGGVQLSELWCDDSYTQNGFYYLFFYFTLQNKSDVEIALPFNGLSGGDVLDNFSMKLDGQPKEHYRLYACSHNTIFRPQEAGHLEFLQAGESRFATNGIYLTKEEYDTLYTGGHTVEFTFTCNGEVLTLRGDPRIGIWESV